MFVRFVVEEDDAELVVGDLAGVADEEVGGDPSLCVGEAAAPAVDLPHHGAVAQVRVG